MTATNQEATSEIATIQKMPPAYSPTAELAKPMGRKPTAVTSVPARPELGAKTIDYAYDALGRLLTEARHYEGGTATTTHAYDLCGNETYLAEPGQPALTKAYDLAGRLTKTTAGAVLAPGGPTVNLTLEEYLGLA